MTTTTTTLRPIKPNLRLESATQNESALGTPVFRNDVPTDDFDYRPQHPNSFYHRLLDTIERYWVDRYDYFLQERGYEFRSRYKPGWSPSWVASGKDELDCEDSLIRLFPHVIDAKRVKDNLSVIVKQLYKDKKELNIMRYFASETLVNDPHNHVVQLIDAFRDHVDPDVEFLVVPLLRPFYHPSFGAVGEVLDFVSQVLEGLAFIHAHNVAHNDISNANIMMDGWPILPNGWHPIMDEFTTDFGHYVWPLPRIDFPVRYYFIDFGKSYHFQASQRHVVYDYGGADQDVPEFKCETGQAYNPFSSDIYTVANLFLKEFQQKYVGLEFLGELVEFMRVDEPSRRPSAESSLVKWNAIRSTLDPKHNRRRIYTPDQTLTNRVVLDAVAAARSSIHGISRLFSG